MALNEEKLGWTTEFSGIWTFGITVYRPIWFPWILRGFYLLANVETFQILHESKWLATQVHIVVFFLAYLQKSVLRRQRLWRDLPCVSSVVCKCSQNARYDCFMQVGFEDMTVVKLFLIARILIACDCGCDKHLVNTLTTSQALNVRRVQASSHWSNTIVRWKESQLPRPVVATSFQSVVATILWNDHLVSFSQWFLGLQRPEPRQLKKHHAEESDPAPVNLLHLGSQWICWIKRLPKRMSEKGGSPVVGFFNATRKGCLWTYHTSYHF